jgi:hypothetical protein
MTTKQEFCYSTDEENFHGGFATEEDAFAEACACTDPDCTVWTGEIVPAMSFLRKKMWFAEDALERMNDSLSDDIGGEDVPIKMSAENLAALNALILDFVEKHGDFRRWGVANVKERATVAPEEL